MTELRKRNRSHNIKAPLASNQIYYYSASASNKHRPTIQSEELLLARRRPRARNNPPILNIEKNENQDLCHVEARDGGSCGRIITTMVQRNEPRSPLAGDQELSVISSRARATKRGGRILSSATIIAALWTIATMSNFVPASPASAATATAKKGFSRELEKQIVDKILGEGYDKRIRPSGINNMTGKNDGPAVVRVNTLIRSISKIDDVTMEYSVQLTLRQEWVDERLAYSKMPLYKDYDFNSITLTEQERLWKPDLFFRNEKEGHFHKIIMPNVLLRIKGDGAVLYSIRISLVLACPMDLKYYPLDKQNCTIEMASYGYTDADLKFLWKEQSPVQINQPLTLPRFALERHVTAYCTSRTATGAYSCLRVDLIFKREFSYYLIQIYIPCCMLVIVSWVSFWLDPNAIPARVSLGVTTLLTMATQISGINASLPPVSYTKAIDVWTGVCLTFVFGALLEFALVNYASRSDAHARLHQAKQEEELRARELEYQHRQHLVSWQPAANSNQHQPPGIHQQQQQQTGSGPNNRPLNKQVSSSPYGNGTGNYGQKYPINRSTEYKPLPQLVAGSNPTQQVADLPSNQNAADKSNGLKPATPTGRKHHYARQTGEQQGDKARLLSGTTTTTTTTNNNNNNNANSHWQVSNGAKQCEIHFGQLPGGGHSTASGGQQRQQLARNPLARQNNKGSPNFCRAWLNKFPSRSKRIDVISRIFFPKMFALFNLVYWTTYLFREDDIARV